MTEFYFNGKDLIEMGLTPGPHFAAILKDLNASMERTKTMGEDDAQAVWSSIIEGHMASIRAEAAARLARAVPMHAEPVAIALNIEADSEEEQTNINSVKEAMTLLARTPTVETVVVMPDACPAGAISVGGVAAARNAIHPGWHSADICCSMFATNLGKIDPKAVMDAAFAVSHFGPGGRPRHAEIKLPKHLLDMLMAGNPFLQGDKLQAKARSDMGSSGDGNHFLYTGRSASTGDVWLISHHGSRGFGAAVYKNGMDVAERFRKEICPDLDKGHAWIPYDTDEGRAYWEALEVVREWTKVNHSVLHQAVVERLGANIQHQRWNPHNFVFRDDKDPTLFWHAKGATPVNNAFLSDTDGTQIIPLNMAQPILFVQGGQGASGYGFAPHGAGRNLSRTQHKKKMGGETDEAIFARETAGIDARFWSGITDISELPSAYKDANAVQAQMSKFGLANVVDRIEPFGAIMAGDWEANAPWKKKAESKRLAKQGKS